MTKSQIVLGEGGAFDQQLEGFTPRNAQTEMAKAVETTIEYGGKLVVESGTGTGKTFAYLVPVIESGKRTIISTGTKHLQEQIFYRDLPSLLKILGRSINAKLLKGRSNYLCRYRLKLNSQQSDLIGRQNQFAFDAIDQWSVKTKTGDISEVKELNESSAIWKKVTSTTDNCLGGNAQITINASLIKRGELRWKPIS